MLGDGPAGDHLDPREGRAPCAAGHRRHPPDERPGSGSLGPDIPGLGDEGATVDRLEDEAPDPSAEDLRQRAGGRRRPRDAAVLLELHDVFRVEYVVPRDAHAEPDVEDEPSTAAAGADAVPPDDVDVRSGWTAGRTRPRAERDELLDGQLVRGKVMTVTR